ncbi:MAG TPA: hypothetical protein VFU05_13585 [Cyclobacteriaceae bacterium]|nr:hypothetical protein [Cyclobacteriaceae bacterium]
MKISTLLLAVILIFLTASFTKENSGNARAKKVQGVDVYIYSEPTRDYEVIESGKVMITLSGRCDEGASQAAKKAAKLNAQGVIIDLSTWKWDAIKYKD